MSSNTPCITFLPSRYWRINYRARLCVPHSAHLKYILEGFLNLNAREEPQILVVLEINCMFICCKLFGWCCFQFINQIVFLCFFCSHFRYTIDFAPHPPSKLLVKPDQKTLSKKIMSKKSRHYIIIIPITYFYKTSSLYCDAYKKEEK